MDVIFDLSAKRVKAKEVTEQKDILCCAWEQCSEPSRTNSKYCSRDCSNKNARKRYAVRKK
jgi:RES domain-containing protein